jgi:hypothetical protein
MFDITNEKLNEFDRFKCQSGGRYLAAVSDGLFGRENAYQQ